MSKNLKIGLIVLLAFLVLPSTAKTEYGEESKDVGFPVAGDRDPIRTLNVFATAYSSDPYQTDSTPCIPAMNFDLCEHYLVYRLEDTIAANFLPLGTKVRFPELYGDKVFTVRDRMNSRYNVASIGYYRIDFYKVEANEQGQIDNKSSKQEAIQFGFKRNVKMEVIGV